jgi:hypothetical protein
MRQVTAALAIAGCAGAGPVMPSRPPVDYCQMAATVLHEVVRSYERQPFGLEDACVKKRAAQAGKIYADARFTDREGLAVVPHRSCTVRDYVIRFDHQHYEASPTPEVVLLLFSPETARGREFNARMETADWPSKRPGVMAMSQCGSAFGVLRREANGWTARVTPPQD